MELRKMELPLPSNGGLKDSKLGLLFIYWFTLLLFLSISLLADANTPAEISAESAVELIEITTARINRNTLQAPFAVYGVNEDDIQKRQYRSLTDIFRDIPGAVAQKTAHGQGSPFLRGFTGFQNIFLVDGIRLNNSVFRSGPNQYWNTVDPLSLQQLEVIMGPSSVLYGSDGIGGTVNAITKNPTLEPPQQAVISLMIQGADAANMNVQRAELQHAWTESTGVRLAANRKDFGDIRSGDGRLPNTGYAEANFEMKLIHKFNNDWQMDLAHFLVHQQDVPRTHKTVFSVPFSGTSIGSELERNLDQRRELSYIKVQNKELDTLSHVNVTLSYHQQDEFRNRIRTRNRSDQRGFSVNTLGLSFDSGFQNDDFGLLFGADHYRDSVDSFASNNTIQGPIADNANYTSLGLFSELSWSVNQQIIMILGTRYSHASASSDRVDVPNIDGPSNLDRSWSDWVSNIKFNYLLNDTTSLYTSISEGFRAPNLSDLSRLDSARSNEFEVPSPNVDSESYISYELGYKKVDSTQTINLAAYYTDIDDQIILFPTGNITADGEVEMSKSNEGNGHVYGAELLYSYKFSNVLSGQVGMSYQYGKLKSIPQAGSALVEDFIDRLQPFTMQASLKYDQNNWWVEGQIIIMSKADKLSARDQNDIERIPPGGTPGFSTANIRFGYLVNDNVQLTFSIDNLLDKNYRVHGSGQNEVGRNMIASAFITF